MKFVVFLLPVLFWCEWCCQEGGNDVQRNENLDKREGSRIREDCHTGRNVDPMVSLVESLNKGTYGEIWREGTDLRQCLDPLIEEFRRMPTKKRTELLNDFIVILVDSRRSFVRKVLNVNEYLKSLLNILFDFSIREGNGYSQGYSYVAVECLIQRKNDYNESKKLFFDVMTKLKIKCLGYEGNYIGLFKKFLKDDSFRGLVLVAITEKADNKTFFDKKFEVLWIGDFLSGLLFSFFSRSLDSGNSWKRILLCLEKGECFDVFNEFCLASDYVLTCVRDKCGNGEKVDFYVVHGIMRKYLNG